MGRTSSFACVVLLFLAAVCAGCGQGQESAPAEGDGEAGGPVTIDLWHSETAATLQTLEQMVTRFNASQDEVLVRPVFQGSGDETIAKLVAGLPGGQVPAIVSLAEVHAQKMIDSGAIAPIQEFIDRENYDRSDLDEKAIAYYTARDTLWAMPFAMTVPLLYYNKIAFREAGLDPERPPGDLEELRQYSERLVQRGVAQGGLALDIHPWYLEVTTAEHDDLYANNGNGREGRATSVLFDNDTGRRFFQWWHDTVEEGLTLNVGRNPADAFIALATGRAAMTFGSSEPLRALVEGLEAGYEGLELGVSPLPGVPGGTGLPGIFSRGFWVFGLRPEEEQEAAWKFITWFVQPEQQAEWFAGTGYLPVSRSSVDLPAAKDVVARHPEFRVALDLYLTARATPGALGPLLGPFQEVHDAVARAVEEMLLESKDPVQALEDAAARSNEALAEYNERVGE